MRSTTCVYLLAVAVVWAQASPSLAQQAAPEATSHGVDRGDGAAALAKLMTLVGTWDAPLHGGVMTDVFRPIARGTALLEEEWYGGKESTATVFYLVDGELRADHFCDLGNQPRYAALAFTGSTLEFGMRDATGLAEHPRHFASVTFRFLDADHHTQVWPEVEGGTDVKVYTLEFTRRPAPAEGGP